MAQVVTASRLSAFSPSVFEMLMRPSPVDNFECIVALRNCIVNAIGLEISYEDLAKRCHLEYATDLPDCLLVIFSVSNMLYDGLHLPDCGHGGKALTEGKWVYHGTKNLPGILQSNGVMLDAINTADGKQGWYHGQFKCALYYAHPMLLGREWYKPVLKVRADCWNKCKTWGYTKSGCMRYSITEIILVPQSCFLARPCT